MSSTPNPREWLRDYEAEAVLNYQAQVFSGANTPTKGAISPFPTHHAGLEQYSFGDTEIFLEVPISKHMLNIGLLSPTQTNNMEKSAWATIDMTDPAVDDLITVLTFYRQKALDNA